MLINIKNLGVLAYTHGFTLWMYGQNKLPGGSQLPPFADILVPGHFAPAADMLSVGDTIFVAAPDRSAVLAVRAFDGTSPVVRVMAAAP